MKIIAKWKAREMCLRSSVHREIRPCRPDPEYTLSWLCGVGRTGMGVDRRSGGDVLRAQGKLAEGLEIIQDGLTPLWPGCETRRWSWCRSFVVVGQDEVRRGKINHESKPSFLVVLICYYGRAD